jgi:hypothetical protein
MFCPECEGEFLPVITQCPTCGVSLVAALPSEDALPSDDPVVTAVEVWNPAEAEIVCSLLRGHGIPCILKAENQYAVDATYTIGPLARRRILVRESDLDRAREILQADPLPDLGGENSG